MPPSPPLTKDNVNDAASESASAVSTSDEWEGESAPITGDGDSTTTTTTPEDKLAEGQLDPAILQMGRVQVLFSASFLSAR